MTTPDSPHGMDPKNRERFVGDNDKPALHIHTGSDEELTADELALRRLLHDAVQDLEPRPDTLNHLRRAVPARRAHRRQLLVGAAAACLLAVAAVPAAIHAATTASSHSPNAANASSAHDTGGTDGASGGEEDTDTRSDGAADSAKQTPDKGGRTSPGTAPTQATSSAADPSDTLAATAPICTTADLGNATAATGTADAGGQVSGYFQVANISPGPCTIDGGGSVTFTAQGSADASRISVVDHTAGDGTSLPDTSGQPLILEAGHTYQVQFTWVPASGGDTTGCAATSSPTPTATASEDTSGGTPTSDGGTTTSLDSVSDGGGSASILLTHTPEAGDPAVGTTISDACAGTVYKTGAIGTT